MVARMSSRLRQSRASYGIAALYALAMVLLGFAHRPIPLQTVEPVSLAAYALPDGTLPTLCGHDDAQAPVKAAPGHCEACALASAPGLIPPDAASFVAPGVLRRVAWIDPHGQFLPSAQRAPASRGPPAHFLTA